MKAWLVVRRSATLIVAIAAALTVLTAAFVAAVDAGYGRALLIRCFESRIGRPIQVNGPLRAHIFSLNPRVVAERVVIGNPPWMPTGLAAEIGRLSVVLKLPGFGRPSGIVALDMEGATLHLVRDATGHANWQLTDPGKRRTQKNSSVVRSLSMPKAHVVLADALQHLQFVGIVSAKDLSGAGGAHPLRIDGAGQLNGRPVSFELTADSLATASHDKPYHFAFAERSSTSRLDARGFLPQPFEYSVIDAMFEAAGPDLKDLYFLTGVRLIDTGSYRLSGEVSRRGAHTQFSHLIVTSGRSDVHGTVSIDSSSVRRKLDLDLKSQLLRLSDLGVRAAGRTTEPESPLLLSNATLNPKVLRKHDATVKFRAHQVDAGRLSLHEVSVKATIDHGVLTVAPLVAEVLGGSLSAHLTLDASRDVPAANVDLKINDLQLGQFPYKDAGHPPIEGPMQAQVMVTGAGSSIHQVAATANGTVSAQIPHGAIREALAESSSGIDLHALGLLLTKSKQDVPVRCAIANFKAEHGTLIAQNMIVDADPVLITGEGQIHLDSEALELVIHGHPKSLRLFRLRAPVLVRGTLAHPAINIQGSKVIPIIVDPGRARNADCTALLTGVNSGNTRGQSPR